VPPCCGAADFDPARYTRRAQENHGDAGRGERLIRDDTKTTCLRCHKIGNAGAEFGPDLSNVGGKLGREHLVQSILEPSRQIVEGFRGVTVVTTAGQVVSGFAPVEAEGQLKLVDAQGQRVAVRLEDIAERKVSATSPMPDNLAATLTPDEFCDLVANLETLRAAGQSSPGSSVKGNLSLPGGFERETLASGITGATALAPLPDGRILVCEQTGTLRLVDPERKADRLLPEPCIKLPVDDQWERGLLGVAVDPDFKSNGFVYVVYVAREPYPHHRVSRLTLAGNVAAAGSERVLFEGDDQSKLGGQVPAGHQGGAIHFGTDGKLYVALGEQTAEAPAQPLETLLGKILRLEPDGGIPADNPFVSQTTGKYRAIWARGCRNPFTFAIDPASGRMLINDVGGKFEEINQGRAGANYGWPVVDHGPTADAAFQGPIFWYPAASVSGGAFCPAGKQPHAFGSQYGGRYFFMDFVQGWIKTLDPNSPERPVPAEVFATGLARPVDLAFAPDGSLLVLLRDAWVRDDHFKPGTGSLERIRRGDGG
jgi:putative heme-binding domain-containing protein